ncbi:MAG: TadE/TadG family type IV pilus assembly protein, partial [Paracoccaceae bacterium]
GGSCIGQNETISPDTMALPRDTCFNSWTCASPSARFGDGVWDYAAYISMNHGGVDGHLTSQSVPTQYPGTRYETYLREIAYGDSLAGGSSDILYGLAETGRPLCSPNMAPSPKRRVVIAAGVDCVANPINGQTNDVIVEEFFELFMTEPVGDDGLSPPTLDFWLEIIGSAGGDGFSAAGAGGMFRDVVQLYR